MRSVTELSDDLLLVSTHDEGGAGPELSSAERAVIQLVLRGFSNSAIARSRSCSSYTVANQLASVYRKLSVSGRRELQARVADP